MEASKNKYGSIISPPEGVEVTENPTSIYWFDENGILCSLYKKVPPVSMEENKRIMDAFIEMTKGKKFCLMLDITNSSASSKDKESREFADREFPKIVKAMALVSGSAMGRMLANLFFALKPTPYPSKMFNNEKDAKEWLKQYL